MPVLSGTVYRHLFWRRYAVPAVLVITMAVRSAAYAVDFCKKMSKNTKLLRTRCISQAQSAPQLVFDRGSAPDPARGAYDAPSDLLVGWVRGITLPFPSTLDVFGASILGAGASIDSTASSFSIN